MTDALSMPGLTLAAGALSYHDITSFLLGVGVLLGAARLMGEIARLLGQPMVLGEILAGVVLGKTILNRFAPGVFETLFPASGAASIGLDIILVLSACLLLLVAGLEVDLSVVLKQGKATFGVSMTGMVIPFVLGFGVAYLLPQFIGYDTNNPPEAKVPFALFVGIAMAITALPVIAKVLMDLNLLRSDLGMLIMSSAMINDLIGWIGFAMVLALIQSTGVADGSSGFAPDNPIWMTIGFTLLFVGGMLTVGRVIAHKLLAPIQAYASWPGGVLGFVLVAALLCSALTEKMGIHSIFGAFIAGVAIGDSSHLRRQTRQTIEQFIGNIFAPLFFAGIALRVDFLAYFDFGTVAVVLVVAIAGKAIGCWAGAKWAGLSTRESWAVGFGMSARGALEIILGQLALDAGLITEKLFVAIVVMAIVTSLMAGPLMNLLLKRKVRPKLRDMIPAKVGYVGHIDAADRRSVIAAMSAAAQEHLGPEVGDIDAAVWEREQLTATGLGHGLAVPHARLPGVKKAIVFLGTCATGVDFDAPDGEPAHIICLILSPEDDATAQIEALDAVARALGADPTRTAVMRSNSQTELLAALSVADAEHEHENAH
ncbi:MAG: cation:proton antiporter [Planctomycetota bacterium]